MTKKIVRVRLKLLVRVKIIRTQVKMNFKVI